MRYLNVCSPKLLCHVLLCPCRPRLKHPLDMRMPLLVDDGPPSSNPSHDSPSGSSKSSVLGDLAAPTSQRVPADAWRSSGAGSRDRPLWGSEALLEAPEMQGAQQLVGESICSLQVGEHARSKQLVKLLSWEGLQVGEHACIKTQAGCSPGLLDAPESLPQQGWCIALGTSATLQTWQLLCLAHLPAGAQQTDGLCRLPSAEH